VADVSLPFYTGLWSVWVVRILQP